MKGLTPKQRANGILKGVQVLLKKYSTSELADRKPLSRASPKIEKHLTRAVNIACEKAGLDPNSPSTEQELGRWLSWALYGVPGGRRKSWTKKRLRKLLRNFDDAKARRPEESEKEICMDLAKNLAVYQKVSHRTLLRKLQDAKRIRAKANLAS